MARTTDTIGPLENGYLPLASLVRALAADVEPVSSVGNLQDYHPSEGRVAEITSGGQPYDVYVGTGEEWLDVQAALGLSTALQRTTPQDLTAADAPAPSSNGVQAVHDGTGTPAAGVYTSDPGNNQWVGGDARTTGTTIAY